MNLRSIEYFLIAAEELNFTRAAERLYISQQALSSHIQRLEEEYKVHLFARKPSLRLTPEGEQMLFYGRLLLEDERKMRMAFSDISVNCRSTLSVGISRLRGSLFFPRIWNHYHKTHPNISIQLIDGNTTKFDELLQAGKIDLFIGINVLEEPDQIRIELAQEKTQCFMSHDLLLRYHPYDYQEILDSFKHGADPSAIIDMPFIGLCRGNRMRDTLDYFTQSRRLKPNFIFECDQQRVIYSLAREGAGVGFLSPMVLYQYLGDIRSKGGNYHIFPVVDDLPDTKVHLVYRSDFPAPGYMKDFIQSSIEVFHSYSRTVLENFV